MKSLIKVGLLIGVLLITSCAKDNSKQSGTRVTRAGGTAPNSPESVNTGWGYLQSSQVSKVALGFYSSNATVTNSQSEAVKGLVSSVINDISDISIRESNSTTVAGALSFVNGNVVPSKTRFGIVIFDEYAFQNPQEAIGIYMGPERGVTTVGNLYGSSSNGAFNITFTDAFGNIRLQGQMSGGQATVDIYYNNKSSSAMFSGADVYLGTAQIPVNGLIFN